MLTIRHGTLAVGLLILIVAGCQFLSRKMRGVTQLSTFPHAAHSRGRRFACLKCHPISDSRALPSFPARQVCTQCHDEDEDEEAAELIGRFFPPGEQRGRWAHAGMQDEDIILAHAAHAAEGEASCRTCHEDVVTSSAIFSDMKMAMDRCMECHQREAPRHLECASCHKKIDRTTSPASHENAWLTRHGGRWRVAAGATTSDRCQLCHEQNTCDTCHMTTRPRSHNVYWKSRGHGIASGVDRQRCFVCHQRDTCDRCHSQTRPRSHTGSFGPPTNRHCNTCHLPISLREHCGVCHATTPSHTAAPMLRSKPAEHMTASQPQCRTCHTPLPHPDSGDNCRFCHR